MPVAELQVRRLLFLSLRVARVLFRGRLVELVVGLFLTAQDVLRVLGQAKTGVHGDFPARNEWTALMRLSQRQQPRTVFAPDQLQALLFLHVLHKRGKRRDGELHPLLNARIAGWTRGALFLAAGRGVINGGAVVEPESRRDVLCEPLHGCGRLLPGEVNRFDLEGQRQWGEQTTAAHPPNVIVSQRRAPCAPFRSVRRTAAAPRTGSLRAAWRRRPGNSSRLRAGSREEHRPRGRWQSNWSSEPRRSTWNHSGRPEDLGFAVRFGIGNQFIQKRSSSVLYRRQGKLFLIFFFDDSTVHCLGEHTWYSNLSLFHGLYNDSSANIEKRVSDHSK